MRIDFIITELNVGGAEKALTRIAIGMQQLGHDVRVLAIGAEPVGEQAVLFESLKLEGIECRFGGFRHWSNAFSAIQWLRSQLREHPPELCQSFLFHANCLGVYAARKENVRCFVGGLRVAESRFLRGIVERYAVRSMSRLVCVSEQVQRFAIRYLKASASKCTVIPNAVDVETIRAATPFDWSELGWGKDVEVALFVGRFHPQKGLELIRQQAEQLLVGQSGQQASERKLVLIGEGPLRGSISAWADGLAGDRVRVLPWQSNVPAFLRASKMLILPSHYEGMPNVVLEAMAAGLPVVCSQIEGAEEIFGRPAASDLASDPISDSSEIGELRSHCQLFPVRDSHRMALLAERFFADSSLCQRLGDENRRHVANCFSIDSAIEAYAAVYESVYESVLRGSKSG